MTKQFVDAIYYNGARHLPLSISGNGLPHPRDFGLRPDMISTACFRGFYGEYTIREDHLWLTHLVVNHNGDYPPITNVKALYEEDRVLNDDEPEPEFLNGRWIRRLHHADVIERALHYDGGIYTNLNVPAPLTGGILLGIDDLDVPYIEYDLNYLISSKIIFELLFENGKLVKMIDHTLEVDKMRAFVLRLPELDHKSAFYQQLKVEISLWMRSTLSLEYKFLDMIWLDEIYAEKQ